MLKKQKEMMTFVINVVIGLQKDILLKRSDKKYGYLLVKVGNTDAYSLFNIIQIYTNNSIEVKESYIMLLIYH